MTYTFPFLATTDGSAILEDSKNKSRKKRSHVANVKVEEIVRFLCSTILFKFELNPSIIFISLFG